MDRVGHKSSGLGRPLSLWEKPPLEKPRHEWCVCEGIKHSNQIFTKTHRSTNGAEGRPFVWLMKTLSAGLQGAVSLGGVWATQPCREGNQTPHKVKGSSGAVIFPAFVEDPPGTWGPCRKQLVRACLQARALLLSSLGNSGSPVGPAQTPPWAPPPALSLLPLLTVVRSEHVWPRVRPRRLSPLHDPTALRAGLSWCRRPSRPTHGTDSCPYSQLG